MKQKPTADILFIHAIDYPFLGLMSISAVLKKYGYNADVLVASSEREILDFLASGNYPLVGFPTMIGEEKLVFKRAMVVKKRFPHVKTVLGGMYPTLNPEKAISCDAVDYIVRGEGEYPVLELVEALKENGPVEGIKNLWTKKHGRVYSNTLRPLNDLDDLPPFDYLLYENYPHIMEDRTKSYVISRGCPFACSFCYNRALRDAYQGCGKYVRIKSPVKVIEEIKRLQEQTPVETLLVLDDSLLTNRSFLREFADLFPKLGLSLVALARADQIDEEVADLLKQCRARCIQIAVESGDQAYRNGVLKKKISNRQIIDAVSLLKKRGMVVVSLNMMALPNETVEMALSTVDLNIQAGVDFATTGFYCPYPGVELSDYARDLYGLPEDFFENLTSDYTTRPLLPVAEKHQIFNIQRLTLFMVRFPIFRSCLDGLIKLPPNPVFEFIYNAMRLYEHKTKTNSSMISVFKYALSHFRLRRTVDMVINKQGSERIGL